MPTLRPSQSARLAPVTECGSATASLDSQKALGDAKTEILELRKQLGLPEELPKLQPPAAIGRHLPESSGGFTPEPGMPRTAGSRASDAVSLPGSPRADTAVAGKHYAGSWLSTKPAPASDRSELSTADSVASSAWSERSALIRANFKPTQQLFEQRFSTPRVVRTRDGRTRIVPRRNVTRYGPNFTVCYCSCLLLFLAFLLFLPLPHDIVLLARQKACARSQLRKLLGVSCAPARQLTDSVV
jgi:hypothetical protein